MNPTLSDTGPQSRNWQERLQLIMDMVREISMQTDPQAMVRAYGARMKKLFPVDRIIALSRRDLLPPRYRITRCSMWEREVNPWRERELLPVLEGGLLGELIYGNEPRIIDELQLDEGDPSHDYLFGQSSLLAVPQFERGEALNLIVFTRSEPSAFDPEMLPENLWTSNLFGRATKNLVLAEQVREAYELVDHELKVVADIQRSLLPAELPAIPYLSLATHYETSQRAGGDYYDFLRLPDGRWGLLIADVSGHGTPAAVMMAITHSIVRVAPLESPGQFLRFVNQRLIADYTTRHASFVTACYGIFDPETRRFSYASAGHPAPRRMPCGGGPVSPLDSPAGFPLGIEADAEFIEEVVELQPGDQLVFFTDGLTEAFGPGGEMFGLHRLDSVLAECKSDSNEIIAGILDALRKYTADLPLCDDCTIVVGKVH